MNVISAAFLVCHLSLPNNSQMTVSEPVTENQAQLKYVYSVQTPRGAQDYVIEAQVMNLHRPPNGTVRGFLSMKQEVPLSEPRNYAINHCFKLPCEMSLVATLNGAGAMAQCKIEQNMQSARQSKRQADTFFRQNRDGYPR